jgi:hypothetical protein
MKIQIDSELNYRIVKKNWFKTTVVILIIVGLVVFNIHMLMKNPQVRIIYQQITPEVAMVNNDVPLTRDSVTKCLVENGCVLANVAIAQAEIESGLGKSAVGKKAKNLFGITYHSCKYVTGKYGPYATYNTYRDNIKCYIHIQEHYLRAIDGKYAGAPDYIQTIRKIK